MNTAALAQQVSSTKEVPLSTQVGRAVKDPLVNISRVMWCYAGNAGLATPWHEDLSNGYNFYYKQVHKFVEYLEKEDISLTAYASFIFPIMDYTMYSRVSLLIAGKGERSWMRKLRASAGSREMMDEVADILFHFIQMQVQVNGKSEIQRSRVVEKDVLRKGKYCAAYHRLVDRVKQCKANGIDPLVWARAKVRNHIEFFPGEKIHFRAFVNVNGLDPKEEDLTRQTNDEWREIRSFLGVSPECEFVDGRIPKGWGSASVDREDLKKIVRIDKDGYYWYLDGTQYRGRRHYMQNAYWVISCTPETFGQFKDSWNDVRLMSKAPTWDEYAVWGEYSNLWDQYGEPMNGSGRSVKWRLSKEE